MCLHVGLSVCNCGSKMGQEGQKIGQEFIKKFFELEARKMKTGQLFCLFYFHFVLRFGYRLPEKLMWNEEQVVNELLAFG